MKCRIAGVVFAAGMLAGCVAAGTSPPAAQPDVWMGDLAHEGYRIETGRFETRTAYGPRTFAHRLTKGDAVWLCHYLGSTVEPDRVTDYRCVPAATGPA